MKKIQMTVFFSSCVFMLLLFSSCKTEPKPIDFGSDACEFCQMIIIDNHYGGELITEKGKVFKFDSGECMARYIKSQHLESAKFQALLVV